MVLRHLVPNWYDKLGVNFRSVKLCGQIYLTRVLYCYQNSEIWRPCDADSTGTQAFRFRIMAAGEDAYKRALPLKTLNLSSSFRWTALTKARKSCCLVAARRASSASE